MGEGGAASYKFNSFQEIRSHSSILFNERMAILFYLLDMKNLLLYKSKSVPAIYEVYSIIKQLYKNIRTLIRFNDTMRISMNLETKDQGIYTTDVAMSLIDNMLLYSEQNGYTEKRIYIIMRELENIEVLLKDVLQYFQYFIRADFRQKPDVEIATEKYKEVADGRTVEQLRELVGKNHKVDFESLGSARISIEENSIDYDPVTDGGIEEYKDDNEDSYIDLKEQRREDKEQEEEEHLKELQDYSDKDNDELNEYLEEDTLNLDEEDL